MSKTKLVFHRYTTGTKKSIWNTIKWLNEKTRLTNYNQVDGDISNMDYDPNKKLYIEIKVYEYE